MRHISELILKFLLKTVGKKRLISDAVSDDIKTLNATDKTKELVYEYYIKKINVVLIVLMIGMILFIVSMIYVSKQKKLETDFVTRADYGMGSTDYDLNMNWSGKDEEKDLSISIDEMTYSEKEFNEIIDKEKEKFKKKVLGGNSSWNKIDQNLNMSYSFLDYPFNVNYYSDSYDVISSSGEIADIEALTEESRPFCIHALVTYEGFERDINLNGIAVRTIPDEETRFLSDVQSIIKDRNNENKDQEKVYLPEVVDGKEIIWSKQITDNSLLILAVSLVIALYTYISSDKRIRKKVEDRNKKLEIEYPEFVISFALLISAGLTPRKAWEKMAHEKSLTRECVGNEMNITLNEMDSGVPERAAYEHFMKRCGLREYTRFVTLLLQEMENGSKGLVNALELESIESYRLRRSAARLRAEEAGTKLLLPMAIMLMVILAIIVIPAFLEIAI